MAAPGRSALGHRLVRPGLAPRLALAVVLGAVAAAALPPVHALALYFVGFTGLLWLVAKARRAGGAFATGWAFGFGHHSAGLYWIGASFLVDPERYGAVAVPAVLGLSLGLGLFAGAAALFTHLSRTEGWARVLVFAIAYALAEWLRGHVLTGFPWNLPGTIWSVSDAMMQFAALGGVYGLSFVTLLAAALPAAGVGRSAGRSAGRSVGKRAPLLQRLSPWALLAALLGGLWGYGLARLPAATETVPGVVLRIVQGNIPQALKWSAALEEEHFDRYLELSGTPGGAPFTDLVWPETATAFLLDSEPERRQRIAALLPPGGMLLTGAVRIEDTAQGRRYFNSVLAIDDQGAVRARYDKFHLVPFGEYVPLRSVLGLSKLTAGRGDFTPGSGPRTLALDDLPPVSPLICYEAIFPGAVLDPAARPAWLLNVTNDGWFGTTSGPYQHLAAARLRSIEEGLPLVRAANTGISAVTDPYGRIVRRLGLNATGAFDAPLPRALPDPPLYARFGDGLFFLFLGAGALIALALRLRRI